MLLLGRTIPQMQSFLASVETIAAEYGMKPNGTKTELPTKTPGEHTAAEISEWLCGSDHTANYIPRFHDSLGTSFPNCIFTPRRVSRISVQKIKIGMEFPLPGED